MKVILQPPSIPESEKTPFALELLPFIEHQGVISSMNLRFD
jgi:hypothetical protein